MLRILRSTVFDAQYTAKTRSIRQIQRACVIVSTRDVTQCVRSLNFNSYLRKTTYFLWQMDSDPDLFTEDSLIQVKLSGDGARFSRTSNFILLSFSFPSLGLDVLSGRGISVSMYIVQYTM